jgi:hypothetical protein
MKSGNRIGNMSNQHETYQNIEITTMETRNCKSTELIEDAKTKAKKRMKAKRRRCN